MLTLKHLSFTTMINLGLNRNHYQGYILASNLRHITIRPLPTRIICRKHLNTLILLKVEN